MEYEVTVKQVETERLASVRGRYRMSQLSLIVPRELTRVVDALRAQGGQASGGAIAVYREWNDDTVEVELGYPVTGAFASSENGVLESALPAGKAVATVHVGPYDKVAEAYKAVMDYSDASDVTLADVMWERYVAGPGSEDDPAKYITEIYWLLA